MGDMISLKQGHSIYIYDEEMSLITEMLISRGIDTKALDVEQNILNLSQSYVGYIKTRKRIIEVSPKQEALTLNHIMRIYYFVHGSFRNFQDKTFDIDYSQNYMNIIEMFMNELKKIKNKGLPTDYVTNIENSRYIKGSVDYLKSFMKILIKEENPFYCKVDDLTQNTYLNRVIKAAYSKIVNKDKN